MGRQVQNDFARFVRYAGEESVCLPMAAEIHLANPISPSRYVNYATGDEPLQAKYGYEQWRLERLRTLKAQWDPEGRFSHYHPIS
jgi:hypothetical protein